MKRKTILIIIIILIILLVGIDAYFIVRKSTLVNLNKIITNIQPVIPTNNTNNDLAQSQVSIISEGFVPATINIKPGQTIVWTNQDKEMHQVASDPHPTHTLLPGFDSLESLKKDESYAYTFEKTGTFTYHDHLNPFTIKGTVVVKD